MEREVITPAAIGNVTRTEDGNIQILLMKNKNDSSISHSIVLNDAMAIDLIELLQWKLLQSGCDPLQWKVR